MEKVSLSANDSAAVEAVALGMPVSGAVTTGPTQIGSFNVMGRTILPGSFNVAGDRYSVVNKILQPGESYQGEPGVMMYMSNDVTMQANFAGWRMFSGEGLAKLSFTNRGSGPGYLGLTPNMPMAIVLPMDMNRMRSINCKRGAFMAGDPTVKVYPKLLPAASPLACCCGGMPPIIQQLTGAGIALVNAGGTVVARDLQPGEKLLVDSDAVVAFTDGVTYDVQQVGSPLTCCLGGEGCFNTELTGPGTIYLQSLSYEKLIKTLVRQTGGGGQKGEEMSGGPSTEEMSR